MIARHPYPVAARLLAILAVALAFAFVLASSAAQPASADGSQWTRSQPHWWDHSGGWRNNHAQWHRQWKDRRHFKHRRPPVHSGVFFSSPGLIITSPGFVVRQPSFIVRQPNFIVRQPAFIVGRPIFVVRHPSFAFKRPVFIAKQPHVFKHDRFPHMGRPWSHESWQREHWRHPPTSPGARRIIAPGMD